MLSVFGSKLTKSRCFSLLCIIDVAVSEGCSVIFSYAKVCKSAQLIKKIFISYMQQSIIFTCMLLLLISGLVLTL